MNFINELKAINKMLWWKKSEDHPKGVERMCLLARDIEHDIHMLSMYV